MADTSVTAADNVLITCNDDVTSNNLNFVAIRKWSTGVVIAKFHEDGVVDVTGKISRAGTHVIDNSDSGNGDIVVFQKNGSAKLILNYTSGTGATLETTAGNDDSIVLNSAANVVMVLDSDNDSGTTNYFRVVDYSGTRRFDVITSSTTEEINLLDVSGNISFCAQYDAANDHMQVYAGGGRTGGSVLRGIFRATHDGGATTKPALLVLSSKDGNDWYIWVDTTGVVRVNTTDPGNSDTTGTVIGSQT